MAINIWSDDAPAKDLPFFHDLCRLIPKVELHQHLSGSMPIPSVREVLKEVDPSKVPDVIAMTYPPETLEQAWDHQERYFAAVGVAAGAGNYLERLLEATVEVLNEQRVMYSELRIGLKAQPTKREYLGRLESTLARLQGRFPSTMVKLLLTCARDRGFANAAENVELAIERFTSGSPFVCGIEMGGVATEGEFEDFLPLLLKARAAGLPIALHCGEDRGRQDEWRKMLEFKPGRLGHCVHLDGSNFGKLVAERMPVEACLTCHRLHFGIPLEENVFGRLFPTQQVVLGTDNPALYQTNLSEEYVVCCQTFGLSVSELFTLARGAIDFTFVDEAQKCTMRSYFDGRIAMLREKYQIGVGGRSRL